MNNPHSSQTPTVAEPLSALGAALVFGFSTALAIWCAWFITHLPWLEIPEHVSLPMLLVIWTAGMIWAGVGRATQRAALAGLGSGLITAILVLGVLAAALGPKMGEPAPGFEAVTPDALLMASGFLALGAAIGLFGGILGSLLPVQLRHPRGALADFGIVTAVALAPLIIIGGLVTSTNSGMAVPDWPNTFGTNMFLYPLGPRAAPDVYFEHSHRLFGTFVGLTTLVLMIWVLLADPRRWVKIMAVLAFVLVCVQGVLGGLRVLRGSTDIAHDPSLERMLHGVLAQLVFGLVIAIAVVLTPTFRRARDAMRDAAPLANARVLRFVTTGLLHASLLQLLLGAAYRHGVSSSAPGTRHMHILWTHITFSVVVVIFAVAAGSAAASVRHRYGDIGPILRRTGRLVILAVALQFMLGWVTFAFGGHAVQPDTPWQALIRTSHQANGAFLLALTTITYAWTKRLLWAERKARAEISPAPAAHFHELI